MAYIKQHGFDFVAGLDGKPESFVLRGLSLEKEVKYLKERKIISIYLNYFDSKEIQNLDFLKELPLIEKVNINDLEIGYSGLYNLPNLRTAILSVKNKHQHLEYSKFKNLETLSIDWYKNFPDLSHNKKLKELYLWKFKPLNQSFKGVMLPIGLDLLHITETNIESLEGIESLKIKQFEAYYCSQLKSLKGLESVSATIDTLILENCKNILDFEPLRQCLRMKKIILTKCGNIPNLKWLAPMRELKMLTFSGTNILDGDLSYCFGIDYVYFKNSKHYNHRVEEFS